MDFNVRCIYLRILKLGYQVSSVRSKPNNTYAITLRGPRYGYMPTYILRPASSKNCILTADVQETENTKPGAKEWT